MTKQELLELKKEYQEADKQLREVLQRHTDLLQSLQQECHHETVLEVRSNRDEHSARFCTFCSLYREYRSGIEFGPLNSTQPKIVSRYEFYTQRQGGLR